MESMCSGMGKRIALLFLQQFLGGIVKTQLDLDKVHKVAFRDGKLELRDIEFCTVSLTRKLKERGIDWLSSIHLESFSVKEIHIHITWTKWNVKSVNLNFSGVRIVGRLSQSANTSTGEDSISKNGPDESLCALSEYLKDGDYEETTEVDNDSVSKNDTGAIITDYMQKILSRLCCSMIDVEIRLRDDFDETAEPNEDFEYLACFEKLDWEVTDNHTGKVDSSTQKSLRSEATAALSKKLSIKGFRLQVRDTWIIKGGDSGIDIDITIDPDTESANEDSYRILVSSPTKILIDLPLDKTSRVLQTVMRILSQHSNSQPNERSEAHSSFEEAAQAEDGGGDCAIATGQYFHDTEYDYDSDDDSDEFCDAVSTNGVPSTSSSQYSILSQSIQQKVQDAFNNISAAALQKQDLDKSFGMADELINSSDRKINQEGETESFIEWTVDVSSACLTLKMNDTTFGMSFCNFSFRRNRDGTWIDLGRIDVWEYDPTINHSLINHDFLHNLMIGNGSNWNRSSFSNEDNTAGLMFGFYQESKKAEHASEKHRPCFHGRFKKDGQMDIEFQPMILSLSDRRMDRLATIVRAFSTEFQQIIEKSKSQSWSSDDSQLGQGLRDIEMRDVNTRSDASIESTIKFNGVRIFWAKHDQSGLGAGLLIDISEPRIVSPLPCSLIGAMLNGQEDERMVAMMKEGEEQSIFAYEDQGVIFYVLSGNRFKSAIYLPEPTELRLSSGYIHSDYGDIENLCTRFARSFHNESSEAVIPGEGIIRDPKTMKKLWNHLSIGSYHSKKRKACSLAMDFQQIDIEMDPEFISLLSDVISQSMDSLVKMIAVDKSLCQTPSPNTRDFLFTINIHDLDIKISDKEIDRECTSFFQLSSKSVNCKALSWGGKNCDSFLVLGQHGEGCIYQDKIPCVTWSESALTRGDGQGDGMADAGTSFGGNLASGSSLLVLSTRSFGSGMLSIRTDAMTLESGEAALFSWVHNLIQLLDKNYWSRVYLKNSNASEVLGEAENGHVGPNRGFEDCWDVAFHARDVAICYDYPCSTENCAGAAVLVKDIQGSLTKNRGEMEIDKAVVHFVPDENDEQSDRVCLLRKVESWKRTKSEREVSDFVCDLTEVKMEMKFEPLLTVEIQGESCDLKFCSNSFKAFSSMVESISPPPIAVKDVIPVTSPTINTESSQQSWTTENRRKSEVIKNLKQQDIIKTYTNPKQGCVPVPSSTIDPQTEEAVMIDPMDNLAQDKETFTAIRFGGAMDEDDCEEDLPEVNISPSQLDFKDNYFSSDKCPRELESQSDDVAFKLTIKFNTVTMKLCSGFTIPNEPPDNHLQNSIQLRGSNLINRIEIFDDKRDDRTKMNSVLFSILDLEVVDMSKGWGGLATEDIWRIILECDQHPRETNRPILEVKIDNVLPDSEKPVLPDHRVKIDLLPLRVRLDQRVLDWLKVFFGAEDSPKKPHQDLSPPMCSNCGSSEMMQAYIQSLIFSGSHARIDYRPYKLNMRDLTGGSKAELLNLAPWVNVVLQLKPLQLSGISGWSNLKSALINEWFNDISTNQANKFAPHMTLFRSLYSLSDGASRLFSEPITSYRNDEQIWRGIVKGIYQMFRSVGVEILDASAAVTSTLEKSLKCAEWAVTDDRQEVNNRCLSLGSGSSAGQSDPNNIERYAFAQPASPGEGFVQAGRKLEEGMGYATKKLIRDPVQSLQKEGFRAATVTLIRGVPAVSVAPFRAVAGALNQTSLGLRNSIEPSRRRS